MHEKAYNEDGSSFETSPGDLYNTEIENTQTTLIDTWEHIALFIQSH